MSSRTTTCLCALLLLGGLSAAQAATEVLAPVAKGDRFELRLPSSRFDVGADAREEVETGFRRTVGSRGAYFVDTTTGATLATLSAPGTPKDVAQARALPQPLTTDPERHSAEVSRYLLSAGVPAREVGGTHVTATMAGGGPMGDGVQPSKSTLLWYTTHLDRTLNGVAVEGSYAFAALDSEGKVISEGVYWPEIPAEVVQRAAGLARKLESPTESRAFLSAVRSAQPEVANLDGQVRIVHTNGGYHGAFEARAVYSVIARSPTGGKARILRFDDTGAQVTMADEVNIRRDGDSKKQR